MQQIDSLKLFSQIKTRELLIELSFFFQLNIHQFKCLARFGLMHIVATNVCVWIRTVFKEGIKDIAAYRVAKGEGVSEDYMIKGGEF